MNRFRQQTRMKAKIEPRAGTLAVPYKDFLQVKRPNLALLWDINPEVIRDPERYYG